MERTMQKKIEIIVEEMKKKWDNTSKAGIYLVFYTSLTNRIMFRKNSFGQWRLPDTKAVINNFEDIEPETIIDSLEKGLVKDVGWKLEELPESTNIVIDSSEPVAVIILTDLKNHINTEERFANFVKNKKLKFFSRQKIIKVEKEPDEFIKKAFRAIIARSPKSWLFFA